MAAAFLTDNGTDASRVDLVGEAIALHTSPGIAERRGVSNVRIFGSVLRGDDTPDSDLDLLVDFDRGHPGLDLFGFGGRHSPSHQRDTGTQRR